MPGIFQEQQGGQCASSRVSRGIITEEKVRGILRQGHKWHHGSIVRSVAFKMNEIGNDWQDLSRDFKRITLVTIPRIDCRKAKKKHCERSAGLMNTGFMKLFTILAALFKKTY